MAGPRAAKPSKPTSRKAPTAKATPKKATGSSAWAKPTAGATVLAATDGQSISELIDEVGAGGETHQTAQSARTG